MPITPTSAVRAGDLPGVGVLINTSEFQRALREYDNELQKGTRRELAAVARWGRDLIRADVPIGPAAGGHAFRAYTSGTRGFNPYVRFDRGYREYVGWLDFGGQLPSKASGKPARIVRPIVADGRYFYPGIKAMRPEAVDRVLDVLNTAARQAGLD